MIKVVDYYFSLNSPWSFLGTAHLAEIVKRHGAEVRVKPVDFGQIFPASGGLPLGKRAPQRQAYRLVELKRWSEHLGQAINLQPKHFPAQEARAAHLVIAAGLTGGDPLRLAQAIGHALWCEERDIADPDTLEMIAQETGHDGPALMARAEAPDVEETYQAWTQEALEAGVFGAPSYVVDGEIFWGQDRLDFLERKLSET
jgi:2-hydroxychromene-2-carboxylate isomerase